MKIKATKKSSKNDCIVLEAFQMTKEHSVCFDYWPTWLQEKLINCKIYPTTNNENVCFQIETLEGIMNVNWDDWIIQGINGEIYPCKPAYISKTYDEFTAERVITIEEHIEFINKRLDELNWNPIPSYIKSKIS